MAGGTTIVDRLNKLSGKDATTIAKALENLEEGGGIGGFEIHICTSSEYDSSTLIPTVTNPDASTLYLVPTSSKSKNLFDEYVWTGTDWEKFGTGSVALPSPTTADNGKVLGVDGGEYKLVDGGGKTEKVRITDGVWFWKDGNTGHLVFDTFPLNKNTMNQYLFRASDYWGEISEYPVDIRPAILESGKFQSAVLAGFSGSAYGVSVETLNMAPETVAVVKRTGMLPSDGDGLIGEITYLLLNA